MWPTSRRGLGTKAAAIILLIIIIAGVAAYFVMGRGKGKAGPGESVITVGFTAPLSGPYKDIGKAFLNGLKLWAEDVNNHGGIVIKGKSYNVVIKYYDDKGDPTETAKLYTKLIEEDFVDILVTPPLDLCASQAINVAEKHGKIIIDVTSDDSLFSTGLKYTYQIATPASRVFEPVLSLAKKLDPKSKRIAIIAIDTPASRRIASGIKIWAGTEHYSIVYEYYYAAGTKDFTSIARIIAEKNPDIIVGGGGIEETINLVKALHDAGAKPKLIALLGGTLSDKFAQLGEIALGVMGISEWETVATYSPFKAKTLNATWYGPGVTEFTVKYEKKFGEAPTSVAASAYAAGLIIQYAYEKAQSLASDDLENVLDHARLLTFYGLIQFNNKAELHGLQAAHQLIVIQWQKRGGKLTKVVVAPEDFAVAKPIYPLPWK